MRSHYYMLSAICILIPSTPANADTTGIKYGIGADIINFIMSGYSIRAARVFDHIEIGVGFGTYNMPDWMLEKNTSGSTVEEIDLFLKYNFGKNVTKLFMGVGSDYVVSEVNGTATSEYAVFHNTYLFGSIGYNIRISGHFRLNPSVQAGLLVSGQKEKIVEGLTYTVESYAFGGAIGIYYYF